MNNRYSTAWREAVPQPTGFTGRSRALIRNVVLHTYSHINRHLDESYLRCLYCHYVFDDQKEDFKLLIKNLLKMGEFIDTDTCISMLEGKTKINKRYFHLSFDDGFRNNYTNALPILVKYEVPAIFFVPSSLIEASWEDARNYCMRTTGYSSVIEMLRWDDLREMIASGYEIASHTKTHARFSAISDNQLLMEDEILGSKKELEEKLDFECKYISWPYGKLKDADNKSLDMVKNAGYTACFGAYRGSVLPGSTNVYSIPRHHFEVQWPINHVKYFARGNMEVSL